MTREDPTGSRWEKHERRRSRLIAASLVMNVALSGGLFGIHLVLDRIDQAGKTSACRAEIASRHDRLLDEFMVSLVNRQPLEPTFYTDLDRSVADLTAINELCPRR